jgi:hypothetical protein
VSNPIGTARCSCGLCSPQRPCAACIEATKRANGDECAFLRAALRKMLAAPGDHMTACDRTMGASHPCTCGANEARRLLSESSASTAPLEK